MKAELHISCIYAKSLVPAHVHSFICGSVSGSPQESGFVISVHLLVVSLSSPVPLILPLNSSTGLHEFHRMFSCGSLYLFPLATGWSLSEDSCAKLMFASIKVSANIIVSGIGSYP